MSLGKCLLSSSFHFFKKLDWFCLFFAVELSPYVFWILTPTCICIPYHSSLRYDFFFFNRILFSNMLGICLSLFHENLSSVRDFFFLPLV